MELRQLVTFRAVAEELSFTRAAESLDYAQSSVTAQIQALESELGVPLFERLGKRIMITGAGQRLLPYAERMLSLAEEVRAAVPDGSEPEGTLIIGAPETLCAYRLPPVLTQFRARYPKVQVIFRPDSCSALRRGLSEGGLDMGFLLDDAPPPGNLVVERLRSEPLLFLTYPDHPLTRMRRVEPCALHGEPLLLTEAGCSYRVLFEQILSRAGARPGAILEFGSVEAIKQCVMAGMGSTFLPAATVAGELAQGRLVALPLAGGEHRLMVQMAWHRDKWLSPALRAFLELSRNVLTVEAAA